MAKLSAHGTELIRYFDHRARCLVSVRSDGVTLRRSVWSGWTVFSRKLAEIPLETWREGRKRWIRSFIPTWALKVTHLPTPASVAAMENGTQPVTSTAGLPCPADGADKRGNPSWLVALGLIKAP